MTFAELEAAGFVKHHDCGACGSPVGYLIHPEFAAAVFDSGCGCSGESNYRLLGRGELAEIAPPDAPTGDER